VSNGGLFSTAVDYIGFEQMCLTRPVHGSVFSRRHLSTAMAATHIVALSVAALRDRDAGSEHSDFHVRLLRARQVGADS